MRTEKVSNQSKEGNFFMVSRDALHFILDETKDVLPALAYLVLRRHGQGDNQNLVCAGDPAIQKALGIGRKKARAALNDLRSVAWGPEFHQTALMNARDWNEQCADADRVREGGYNGKSNKVTPPLGDDFIALPNELCISIGEWCDKPRPAPLEQILRITDPRTRGHALRILLGLYEHLDMGDYGGADPSETAFIAWRSEGTAELPVDDGGVTLGYKGEFMGIHFWLVDEDGSTFNARPGFVKEIIGEATEEASEAFFSALEELYKRKLVLHVGVVFDSDPSHNLYASALYPLWVFNRRSREQWDARGNGEGGLAKANHNAAERLGMMVMGSIDLPTIMQEKYSYGEELSALNVYVAASRLDTATVLGVFRPRHLPNDRLTRRGIAKLAAKSREWKADIEGA